jgi:hypothetical protein
MALIATLFLSPALTVAAPVEKFYYLGESKLSSGAGKPLGLEIMLVEKTHDPDNSLITERAIVVGADGKVNQWTVRMSVKEDNTFTLSDDTGKVSGKGTLFGPKWKWTYFEATFDAANGVQIKDENFMTDPTAVTARKKISMPNGKVMFMEMTLKAITPQTFETLRAALMKK